MPASRQPSYPATAVRRFAVSPLQQAWLRELGLEKVWAARPAPQTASATALPIQRVKPTLQKQPAQSETDIAVKPVVRGRPAVRVKTPSVPNPVPIAREIDPLIATLDMTALRERVLSCDACGLHAGRRQAVFGTGVAPASWLIVGEAPGEQEDSQGLPFVGRSGQLLDAMLASVGRSRTSNVYIANVIKCRPPGNRNPRPEEIAACRPYLMRQIALLKPACIVVMGRFAAQTLLDTDAPISKLRGRLHSVKTDEGTDIPVVASYHPAYLLRSPLEKAKAWADLVMAAGL